MVSKAQKFRLGIFIVVTSLLLISFLMLIAGKKIMEKRDNYSIKYENISVTGLQIGGPVKYHGIQIGRIDEINIDSENVANVIVLISIKEGTPLKEDIEATLVPIGITGLLQIEITGGTNETKLLKPNSFIPPGASMLGNITGKAEVIAEKLEILLNNFTQLTNEANRKKLNNILTNTDIIVDDNKNSINIIADNFAETSIELATLTKSAQKSVQSINEIIDSGHIKNILINLDETSSEIADLELKELLNNTNKTIAELERTVTEIGATHLRSRQDILDIVESLKETVEYLNDFSRQIYEDPSLLLRTKRK